MSAVSRALARFRERPPEPVVGCAYCPAGPDADCAPACPTRRCGTCGGQEWVPDLDEPIGYHPVSMNPLYGAKPCPTCR